MRTYISDRLPQFIIVENLPENIIDRNDDQIQHRDHKNFNTDVFKRDKGEIDWSLATGNKDVNLNFEMFLKLIGKNFYKNVPLKKTSGEKKKIKPWVTRVVRHSVKLEISYTNNLSNQEITKPAKSNQRLLKGTKIK